MALIPLAGRVVLTPYLHSDIFADELKRRSGLYVVKPDNKHSFEGTPSVGTVIALPDGYDGELRVGGLVVFSESAPKGFKDPDDNKRTLFVLDLTQVVATMDGADESTN